MARPTDLESKAAWSKATSFAELCALGAQFIEGELPFFPGWLASDIDDETDPLVPYLAAYNRAGFLTLASQPGHALTPGHDARAVALRAFVTGFASPEAARAIEDLTLKTALFAASYALHEHGGPKIPVGVRGGVPYLYSGYAAGQTEFELFEEHLSTEGLAALSGARYVAVVDLAWEARPLLWKALKSASCPGTRGEREVVE